MALNQTHNEVRSFEISENIINRTINKLIDRMEEPNPSGNSSGSSGLLFQVDKTMLNHKCKSHEGQIATNKTD